MKPLSEQQEMDMSNYFKDLRKGNKDGFFATSGMWFSLISMIVFGIFTGKIFTSIGLYKLFYAVGSLILFFLTMYFFVNSLKLWRKYENCKRSHWI